MNRMLRMCVLAAMLAAGFILTQADAGSVEACGFDEPMCIDDYCWPAGDCIRAGEDYCLCQLMKQ
jgi:hypothetical protein